MPRLKTAASVPKPKNRMTAKEAREKGVRSISKPVEITSPTTGEKIAVTSGITLAHYDEENDRYVDVRIHKVISATRKAIVTEANRNEGGSRNRNKPPVKFAIHLDDLDHALLPDINERFIMFGKIARATLLGKLTSCLILGEGGLGKSYTVEKIIEAEGLVEGEDFVKLSGFTTAAGLFTFLKDNHDKIIVLDDIDSVFKDATAGNIMKAILDSKVTRKVQWVTNKAVKSFTFTGSVVFMSNLLKPDFESAILSRTFVVDLFMTPVEKIQRFTYILPNMKWEGDSLALPQRMEVLDLLDKFKYSIHNLNARTLLKGMQLYAESGDMGLVRYQILNS